MKSIELLCASPASTAICSSTVDRKAIIRQGIRSIDRHIHRLGETPRRRSNAAPCSSHLPFDPAASETFRRKSCADADDMASPINSSRYDKPLLDFESDATIPLIKDNRHNYKRLMNPEAFRSLSTRSHQSPLYNPSSPRILKHKLTADRQPNAKASTSPRPTSNHQVIELRVSIHCKGCEGKLRKHISRMEGVTSFSIDLSTKKVTVIGDVTPLSVLTSISKVKNAQFWPSSTTSSSSPSSSSAPSPRLSLTTS